ncbi:MAG: HDIG domain-containing protein [Verrucomicrobia bacterium]|nr:HDIG domain-containing protein [Verrucomicrobiota bacterium]
MLSLFRKYRLVRQGYACEKTRRTAQESEFKRMLEESSEVKWVLLLVFAAGLATLIFWGAQPNQAQRCLLGLLILVTAAAQLWVSLPQTFADNSRLALVFGVLLMHLTAVKVILELMEAGTISFVFGPLMLPYAFAPLILSTLLGRNHGLFASVFASLWASILLRNIDPIQLVMSLISGFVAVFVTLQVRARVQLVKAGCYVGLAVWLLALCFQLIEIYPSNLSDTPWKLVLQQTALSFGVAIGCAIVVSGTLPLLESAFDITTAIFWREKGDLNHPLLKRLSTEAPGTYFHSIQVGQLASEAAEAIQADADFCHTAALFHDIGKLVKPEYFVENQAEGENPHEHLTPSMSALIIMAHVKEGVNLAVEYKLNRQIIDVIQQHHGNSVVWYFYQRALGMKDEALRQGKIANLREEDVPDVEESTFRYPGPLPQTKEAAIISLADSVESASRSLEKPTPQRIEELVERILSSRIEDGQLDDCDLSFKELRTIAESFTATLQSMLHRRIKYPKVEKGDDDDEDQPPTPKTDRIKIRAA